MATVNVIDVVTTSYSDVSVGVKVAVIIADPEIAMVAVVVSLVDRVATAKLEET